MNCVSNHYGPDDARYQAAKVIETVLSFAIENLADGRGGTFTRPMENKIDHLPRYCERDGKPMEQVRIVAAWELPECECCGEPWCAVHMEHYADCDCVGPCNAEDDGWQLEERDGILCGIRPLSAG